jgi:hypothetical protein
MRHRLVPITIFGVLTILGSSAGCGDGGSRVPNAPSPLPAVSPTPPEPAVPLPRPPEAAALAPSISGLSPSTGVAAGATHVEIIGAGFGPRTIVTFDGVAAAMSGWAPGGARLWVITPVHIAGTVDVAVTNPDGQRGQLTRGFTYGVAAPLILDALSTRLGSTAGGTYLSVSGTGFQPGLTVTLDGTQARIIYSVMPTGVSLTTRPHAAGAVDVIVTTKDGQVARIDGGYTYLPPQFLDFNGAWEGYAGDEGEMVFNFTVQNNTLVSVSCGGRALMLSSLPSTSGGDFAVSGNPGANITGGLVRADYAEGTIDMARCTYDTVWFAKRR